MKTLRLLFFLLPIVAFSMNIDERNMLEKKYSFPSEQQEQNDTFLFGASHFSLSSDGNIYIANSKANEIIVFRYDGQYKERFGRQGQGPGDFSNPFFVEKNREVIVVLDNNNFRIQFFDSNWKHIDSQKISKTYTSFVLVDKESFLVSPIVNRTQEHLFEALDLQGVLLTSFGKLIRETQKDRDILNKVHIDVSQNGDIYMVSEFYPIVRKYAKNGELLWEYEVNNQEAINIGRDNDRRLEKAKRGERIGYFNTFNAVKAKDNGCFLLKTMPHFEILDMNDHGEIESTFFYDNEGLYLAFDFDFEIREGRYLFYVLQFGPENKIDVFGQR